VSFEKIYEYKMATNIVTLRHSGYTAVAVVVVDGIIMTMKKTKKRWKIYMSVSTAVVCGEIKVSTRIPRIPSIAETCDLTMKYKIFPRHRSQHPDIIQCTDFNTF
jgi:hypothetical protein